MNQRIFTEIGVVSYEPDDNVKEKKLVTLNSEVIPFYLEKLDDIARENNGHLCLGKVSHHHHLIMSTKKLMSF